MIQEIKFNGYSATPSDYDCLDGDLAVAMGVIPTNGALRGIEMGVPVRMLYKMSVVYVHETSAYKHYITINEDQTEIGWIDGEGDNTGNWITSATKIADVADFVKVEGIGNTLMIVTKEGITYCLWKDGAYIELGDHIPDIDISFGLVGHPRLFSKSDGSKSTFEVEFETPRELANPVSTIVPTDEGVKQLTSQVMAKVNKFVKEQTVDKGRFCFPFLVRYALRLYDGTSLIGHSAPILMNPSTTAAPIVFWDDPVSQGVDSSGKLSLKTTCDIMLMAADLDYAVVRTTDSAQLDNWKDIVKSIDIYISKPIYTYDQNGEIGSLYDADNFGTKFIGRMKALSSTGETEAIWEDRMFQVFAADGTSIAPVLETSYSEWTYKQIYQLYFNRTVPSYTLHLPEFDTKDVNDSIVNTGSFFKLCSIPIEDIELESRKTIEIDDSYLNSLVAREAMSDDYLSHDRLIATNTMVYNQRLHLSGVQRKLFGGFRAQSMFAYKNCDIYTDDGSDYGLAGGTLVLIPIIDRVPYKITTYIKEDSHVYSVQSTDSAYDSDLFLQSSLTDPDNSHGRYFFYPNINAFKMVVEMVGYVGGKVIDLQPHPYLNGAFAFVDYRLPNTIGTPPDIEVSSGNSVPQLNKLYVSEINNPFYFPLLGIYAIGVGEIYNISSATKALSEGQFGQFPLYAFTSDGVWALEVSQTGSYSSMRPLTRDVCTNPNSITQIDGAVLFATDRGIMLLSGSETICISEVLDNELPFKLSTLPRGIELPAMAGHKAEQFDIIPFRRFLAKAEFVYDYTHQKIHVFNPDCGYSYVYSLESKAWGMQASSFKSKVNSYPEAMAITDQGILFDLSLGAQATTMPSAVIVTRPLKLGAPDILKTISGVIVRGNFQRGDVMGVVLYGSRDLVNWFIVASSKDHYLRGFSGTAYKYFRIAIISKTTNSSREGCITGCTIQYTPKLVNQPR